MKVYWMILLLSLLIWYATARRDWRTYGVMSHELKNKEGYKIALIIIFGVLTIFCGLRSGMMDTSAYIGTFERYPIGVSNITWDSQTKDKGFYMLGVLYKTYVSQDYHGWLFLIALVSCIGIGIALYRYASDIGFACFLFIATTMFTYLINGIRQFLCVAILFALSRWLEEQQCVKYIIIVLLLSTIHSSALIMIPIYFLVRLKPWSGYTWIMIIIALILGLGFDYFMPAVDTMLSDTVYSGYSEVLQNGTGSNIFRLIIAAIPVVLSFICKKQLEHTTDKQIQIAANMATINFALYIVANFTSGMTIGRMTIYFDVYNLILLPWLINNYPVLKDRNTIKVCAIGGYIVFFYIQMVLTWNLPYESDILNLFVYS